MNFIDKQLVGHYAQYGEAYRRGLLGVDETSRAMFDASFLDLNWSQQTKVLIALEAGNALGETWHRESASQFFRMIRDHTLQGFYGSPRHGGNRGFASFRMLEIDYPRIFGQNRYKMFPGGEGMPSST